MIEETTLLLSPEVFNGGYIGCGLACIGCNGGYLWLKLARKNKEYIGFLCCLVVFALIRGFFVCRVFWGSGVCGGWVVYVSP